MKCTKNYNARAQPLFSSLNLLFSDVAVAVTVVVILSSLILILELHLTVDRKIGERGIKNALLSKIFIFFDIEQ